MEGKGAEIARCLGYRCPFGDDDNDGNDDNDGGNDGGLRVRDDAAADGAPLDRAPSVVDMWHLRALAVRPGGLLNGPGRRSGWIKLAGVYDGLVFGGGGGGWIDVCLAADAAGDAPGDDGIDGIAHERIRKRLEAEMGPSRWHLRRERRRLRRRGRRQSRGRPADGGGRSSRASGAAETLSVDATWMETGSTGSGCSTPLTANLHPRAGTPLTAASSPGTPAVLPPGIVVGVGGGTTPQDRRRPSPEKWPTGTPATAASTPGTSDKWPSPALLRSPEKWPTPPVPVSRREGRMHRPPRRDRRPKERALLAQIAASASHLLLRQRRRRRSGSALRGGGGGGTSGGGGGLGRCPGLPDLIAVLLLNLESPSLTALVLARIAEGHLRRYCGGEDDGTDGNEGGDGDDCESFASCADENAAEEGSGGEGKEGVGDREPFRIAGGADRDGGRDALSLGLLPLLHILDGELHDALAARGEDGGPDVGPDVVAVRRALALGDVLRGWIASWFCCHASLPLEVASRTVDFLVASHPSMPLYLSVAVLCHPLNKEKFLSLARQWRTSFREPQTESGPTSEESALHPSQSSPQDMTASLSIMLENLFLDLSQELSPRRGSNEDGADASKGDGAERDGDDDDKPILDFFEEAISTAVSFMKRIPPRDIVPLVDGYRGGVLAPYLDPRERDTSTPPSPWTTRPTAPTDYGMIRRTFVHEEALFDERADPSSIRGALTGSAPENYRIALDASGLSTCQLSVQPRTSRNSRPARALVIGIALCVGAQLLRTKQSPFDGTLTMLAEKDSPLFGLAAFVGLPSFLDPLEQSGPTDIETAPPSLPSSENDTKGRLQDTVAEEIPLAPTGVVSSFSEGNQPPSSYDIASLLSDGDQDESSDDINDVELKDQPTSPGMPSLSLDEAVIPEGRLSSIDGISDQTVAEATSLTQTTPGSSSPKSNQPPSKIDIPSFASDCHQDELLDDEKGAESGDLQTSSEVPSSSLDDPADAFAEDALRSNLSPNDHSSDDSYGVDLGGLPSSPLLAGETPKASKSEDENRRIWGGVSKQSGSFFIRGIKNCAKRSRKLGTGIKNRARRSLVGFRDGYIALVGNDDFFL